MAIEKSHLIKHDQLKRELKEISVEAEAARPKGKPIPRWVKDYYCALSLPVTPTGVLNRFLVHHGTYIRYSSRLTRFVVYHVQPKTKTGTWTAIDTSKVVNLLQKTARDMPGEIDVLIAAQAAGFITIPPNHHKNLRLFAEDYSRDQTSIAEAVEILTDYLAGEYQTYIPPLNTVEAAFTRKVEASYPDPGALWIA